MGLNQVLAVLPSPSRQPYAPKPSHIDLPVSFGDMSAQAPDPFWALYPARLGGTPEPIAPAAPAPEEPMTFLDTYRRSDEMKRKALSMQMPQPAQPNLTQVGIAALLQVLGGRGNAGQGFLGGLQSTLAQQNENEQQKYLNEARKLMGEADILEGQGQREQGIYNSKLQRKQFYDQFGQRQDLPAPATQGPIQPKPKSAAQLGFEKVLDDPTSSRAAREKALYWLENEFGTIFGPEEKKFYLYSTHYNDNRVPKPSPKSVTQGHSVAVNPSRAKRGQTGSPIQKAKQSSASLPTTGVELLSYVGGGNPNQLVRIDGVLMTKKAIMDEMGKAIPLKLVTREKAIAKLKGKGITAA